MKTNFILLISIFCLFNYFEQIDSLKWGILSAGRIANDFILSLNNLKKEDHQITAIASRNGTKAKEYATKFNISTSYDNYHDLAKDSNVEVVYVATIHPLHFSAVKLMLENKKHVLCEKPLVIHPEDARELFKIAKDNNVFLMEALWSRFLPAYVQAKQLIDNGTIGEIIHVSSHHLLTGASKGGIERFVNKNLGGSVTLDIGIYSLHAILNAVNFSKPTDMKVLLGRGVDSDLSKNNTDFTVAGIMKFENQVTGSFLMTSIANQLVNEKLSCVRYIGTKGYISIPYPMNGPDTIELNGKVIETKITDEQTGYFWPTSGGLSIQAIEVKKAIDEKRLTSDKMPPELSFLFADLTKEIHDQLNITFPETIRNYDFKQIV